MMEARVGVVVSKMDQQSSDLAVHDHFFLLHYFQCTCYRRELQVRCEKLILLDPELSTKQNVEQMLWKSVFHHMVELIRRQLADDHAEETRVSLNKILDEVCRSVTKVTVHSLLLVIIPLSVFAFKDHFL